MLRMLRMIARPPAAPEDPEGSVALPRETSRVRVAPPDENAAPPAKIPAAQAPRWGAPHEGRGHAPPWGVFTPARAYVRCCAHAGSDLEREVGGGLVGGW